MPSRRIRSARERACPAKIPAGATSLPLHLLGWFHTNVLADVFRDDPTFCPASSEALHRCLREGRLAVSDIVWAELAALFESEQALRGAMGILGVDDLPMQREAATLAGTTWRGTRERGGTRVRVVADFLVAAHAKVQCDRLLTRDRGFCRDHFSDLIIIDPTRGESGGQR